MSYSGGGGGYTDHRGYGSRGYDDLNRPGSGGHGQRRQEYAQRGGRYGSSSGSRGYEGSRGDYGSGSGSYGSGGYDSRGGGSYSSHGGYGGSSRGYDQSRGSYGSSGRYDQSRGGYGRSSRGDQGRGGYDDRGDHSYSSGRGYDDRSRVKLSLQCAIVGQTGSSFDVEIDEGEKVSELKKAIKDQKPNDLKDADGDKLQLFLAKNGNAWMSSDSTDVEALKKGKKTDFIDVLMQENKKMQEEYPLSEYLAYMNDPEVKQIHVLVVVPGILTTIKVDESQDKDRKDELAYYQRIGQEIQNNCREHCEPILDKINQIYNEGPNPKPFVCVEGSSGMGKSQLAFALGGEGTHGRPWFYWTHGIVSEFDQLIYKNFSSISNTFDSVVKKDGLLDLEEDDILNCTSLLYMTKKLWTYGFIIELLRYCSRTNAAMQMIRIENQTFKVAKSNRKDVMDVCSRMEENGEVLPFFILDEMRPSRNKRLSAFQLNVFRACGLVVISMGTDANISNLTGKPGHSRTDPRWWMTAVSSFPPYQSIPFGEPAKQDAWQKVLKLHPVVKHIAEHSRGLFSRCFVDAVVQFAMEKKVMDNETFALTDLLDAAFEAVYVELRRTKGLMITEEGRDAQLMALSYTIGSNELPGTKRPVTDSDSTSEGARKRRKLDVNVGVASMHAHFANLVDEGIADVDVLQGDLRYRDTSNAWSPICQFPAIEKDVLLYLALLGGKKFSAYWDGEYEYPIVRVFVEYHKRSGSDTHGNINAPRNDFSKFENMVVHALFCASRMNGVRGIGFNEFFSGLVGKFKIQTKASDQTENFEVNGLLEGYDGLMKKFTDTKIPFLAPPNAIWPDYILRACGNGDGDCNFGHLVRAKDKDRLDCYVMVPGNDNPLFVWECKHWEKKLDSGAMKKIIEGLNDEYTGRPGPNGQRKRKWNNWDLALVFCDELTHFRQKQMDAWEFPGTGIVTVDCQTWVNKWIIKPEAGEKLVIVLQTGHLFSNGVAGGMDVPGRFALFLQAAKSGDAKTAQLCLKSDQSVDEVDHLGRTALHWAALSGSDEVLSLLLRNGASIDQKDTLDGLSALHYAAFYGHIKTTRLLVVAGASMTLMDNRKMNPLQLTEMASLKLASVQPTHQMIIKYLRGAMKNDVTPPLEHIAGLTVLRLVERQANNLPQAED